MMTQSNRTYLRWWPGLIVWSVLSVCLSVLVGEGSSGAAVIGAPHYREAQPPGELAYQWGLKALVADSLDEAEQWFEQVLEQHPQHLGALMGMAEVAMKRKDDAQARTYLEQALKIAPQQAGVQRAWGRFLITQGNFEAAAVALRQAITLEPMLTELYVDLGHLYFSKLHDYPRAIDAYQTALSQNPNLPDIQYALGGALMVMGKWAEAQAAFQETIRLTPESPLPHQALGRLYAIRKDFSRALKAYDRALALRPGFYQARIGRGDVFAAQGQWDRALDEYLKAENEAPSYAPLQSKLGLLYQQKGQIQKAIHAFQRAIRLDPSQALAYNNLAWIATEQQIMPDEALVWAQKAVALSPEEVAFQDTLGWVYHMRGELFDATRVLEQAVKTDPSLPDVFYHLGVVYAERNDRERALAALKQALAVSEVFPDAEDARKRIKALENP